jgi:hypothetical protein
MYQLQTVVVQQPTEEVPRREVEAALEEGGKDDPLLDILSLELFPGCSPPGRSRPWSTNAWILASVIIDRTHAACGSGMEAPSAAISSLGLMLDLTWHNIFTRICRRSTARSGGASTSLAGVSGWMDG